LFGYSTLLWRWARSRHWVGWQDFRVPATSSKTSTGADTAPYDALLLVSFGGPERPHHVLPFLRNVTAGRDIPEARLAEVAEHYLAFGGRSPINDQCRALLAAVRADLAQRQIHIPVYWGNRNWAPYLSDTVAEMASAGVRRAAAFVTSAYSSYSGCRQYRENLFEGVRNHPGVRIDKLRHYYNHPGFVASFADATMDALEKLPVAVRGDATLIFVTHSIPQSMATSSGPNGDAYVGQHRSVAALVSDDVTRRSGTQHPWQLVYCSRSGPPQVPWLEPDVNDVLTAEARKGRPAVVLIPIGFVSDHMEVVYDLDTEASATADRLGLSFARAATPGIHPEFVSLVVDLLLERAAVERAEPVVRRAAGPLGASWDICASWCCPNPRRPQPALCESTG
jgi:protoporphyrin/coproporphyrin ferrochelatase